LEFQLGGYGSREPVVCENRRRTDKDPHPENGGTINEGVVLDFGVSADNDPVIHVSPTTNDCAVADLGLLLNLGEMPYLDVLSEYRRVVYICRGRAEI
jgi:hypothetical protein